MTTELKQHPDAGKTVTITKGKFKGEEFIVEDYTANLFGVPWYLHTVGNPAVMNATMRHAEENLPPMNSDACYGKIGGLGHIIHESEWAV